MGMIRMPISKMCDTAADVADKRDWPIAACRNRQQWVQAV